MNEFNPYLLANIIPSSYLINSFHVTFFRFSASTEAEREEWLECIRGSIKEHKFYDIVEAKKSALKRKSLKQDFDRIDHNVELLSTNNPNE